MTAHSAPVPSKSIALFTALKFHETAVTTVLEFGHVTNNCTPLTVFARSTRKNHRGIAWSSSTLVRNNDAHPWVECSNRGECDRDTGYVFVHYCLY